MYLTEQAITLFFTLLVTALPWLLFGVIVSSGLLVFLPKQKLANLLPRNRIIGAILGSCLGLIISVTQYGNIPVARRLLLQGVPLSIVFSFLVAAPTINPVVIWLTYKALPDFNNFLFYRVLATGIIAIAVGIIFSFSRDKSIIFDETESLSYTRSTLLKTGTFLVNDPQNDLEKPKNSSLKLFLSNFIRESIELGTWLVFGCAIASIVHTFLPQIQMMQWGQNTISQILIMLLLGFLLSLGSPYNSFVLYPILSNLLPGAWLSFLLFSSVIDLKGFNLLITVFHPKVVLYLILLLFLFTLFFSLIFGYYLA
ncbi:permease [Aphanothece hegewaldii CCALA 016]|uniref:Permease n=1 Tax=Aphanothece hegewaldii CCALA 016 TaxID=2107694 RepID=A0A2T1LUG9_9CHRO|nr:permease [Aphanothece hegewaldii]PSF35183.1 permease [Aphanothece hegewaldii CCALA 016]